MLLDLWTGVTAVVDHLVKVAVVVQTVLAQEVDLVTSVVQEVAQEMAHVQVEDQRLDPVDAQLAIAKQVH